MESTLTIKDLPVTEELDRKAMARVTGGEKTLKDLPKDKPVKLTYVNGDIIGTWANGTTMSIPLV